MKIGEINPIQDVPVKILKEEGVRYEIVLPDADKDHIQRMIFETGQPYELELLRNMRQRINEGDVSADLPLDENLTPAGLLASRGPFP